MADSNTASIPKGSLVLVTGANGFIAAHIAKQFLERGYRVLGTVRDVAKAAFLIDHVFPEYAKRGDFELVAVPDLGAPNAFDEAVKGKGIATIVHVASPLTFDPDPNNTIPQTVGGVVGLLRAAAREPSVKQFVYTSSAPVVTGGGAPGEEIHVTKDRWNREIIKAAWAPPPYEPSRGGATYVAGKAEAEMAMWKFAEEEKPGFDVNSVLPFTTMGQGLDKFHLRGTASWMKNLYNGEPGMMAMVPQSKYSSFFYPVAPCDSRNTDGDSSHSVSRQCKRRRSSTCGSRA
jgi:nucleoside-diphosphate-sugar epimerase